MKLWQVALVTTLWTLIAGYLGFNQGVGFAWEKAADAGRIEGAEAAVKICNWTMKQRGMDAMIDVRPADKEKNEGGGI